MRKLICFIAMSLDGYIAKEDGSVDWLESYAVGADPTRTELMMESIDTIIMGYTTYHQVATQLFPDDWYYHGFQTIVMSHRSMQDKEEISFIDQDIQSIIKELRQSEGKDLWLCGGANVIRQAREADLIDQYWITILPVALGKGIRLFEESNSFEELRLESAIASGSVVEVIYHRK